MRWKLRLTCGAGRKKPWTRLRRAAPAVPPASPKFAYQAGHPARFWHRALSAAVAPSAISLFRYSHSPPPPIMAPAFPPTLIFTVPARRSLRRPRPP